MKKELTEVERMLEEARIFAAMENGGKVCAPSASSSRASEASKEKDRIIADMSNTINVLNDTVKKLSCTIADLQINYEKRIQELLNRIKALTERIDLLTREKYGTTSQKQSSAAKKAEGRDREESEYDGKPEAKTPAPASVSSEKGQAVKYPSRPSRPRSPRYTTMSADTVEEFRTQTDYPEGMTFKCFRDVEVYDRVCYVRKLVFKVAVLTDSKGNEHEFFKPEKGKEDYTLEKYRAFPGTNGTPAFMASVIDQRYNLNMPVNRIMKSLEGDGMHMSQQCLHNWLTAANDMLASIENQLKVKLLEVGAILHIDETWCRIRVKTEDSKNGKYMKKYMWVLVNKKEKTVFYLYDNDENDSRARRPMLDFLEGNKITAVHSDAYNAYKCFAGDRSEVDHLLCWAHTRAKFLFSNVIAHDAEAAWFLEQIGRLCGVEREIKAKEMNEEQTRERRNRDDVKDIMNRLYDKATDMRDNPEKYHYSELMKKALRYMLDGWSGLQKYLEDGRYDIDNSLSERSIRPFTVGRSACKGFTSEEGARIAARFYSLVETCKLNGVSPRDYFVHILKSVTDGNCDYERLTPMAYASKN